MPNKAVFVDRSAALSIFLSPLPGTIACVKLWYFCTYLWLYKLSHWTSQKSILCTKVLKCAKRDCWHKRLLGFLNKLRIIQLPKCLAAWMNNSFYFIGGSSKFEVRFYEFLEISLMYQRLEERGNIILANSSSVNTWNAWDCKSRIELTKLPVSSNSKSNILPLLFSWAYEMS